MDLIRGLDITISLVGLIILLPLLLVIAFLVGITSAGPVFFLQKRVGKKGEDFNLIKFRTMRTHASQEGLLTIGGKDSRITPVGYYLRKFKMDELPQLVNVLKGEMSLVGPRPEVRKYVDHYNEQQKKSLDVLPGITDYASIAFRNESDLLAQSEDPEEYYIKEIMPQKININFIYINNRSVVQYFKILGKTLVATISK